MARLVMLSCILNLHYILINDIRHDTRRMENIAAER